jgi:hypothetical protein
MREERIAATAWRLRAGMLWLVFIGIAGLAVLLAYERHWDGYWQLVPWAVLALILVSFLALVLVPSSATRNLAHLVAAATIIASCLGLWQHFDENYEAAPRDSNYAQRWDDMSLVDRVWEVANGSVGDVPIYAAAALIPIALALSMSTIGIGYRDRPDEYVDPRQRR